MLPLRNLGVPGQRPLARDVGPGQVRPPYPRARGVSPRAVGRLPASVMGRNAMSAMARARGRAFGRGHAARSVRGGAVKG